ncbi:hypothetical protein [Novosphingobium sp.]|uniref:hypothetical protein n=1 Tax=Novosphingobium sp. TaxID=1874826 RepID=UPI003341CA52
MPASLYQFAPAVAVVVLVIAAMVTGLRPIHSWLVPGTVCGLFAGWSIFTVAIEGPFGFWANHTQNAWGNQVWFDLLIAIGIGWALILPRAHAAGMHRWPWLALILCTGCIGFSAMLARCLYLETHRSA